MSPPQKQTLATLSQGSTEDDIDTDEAFLACATPHDTCRVKDVHKA